MGKSAFMAFGFVLLAPGLCSVALSREFAPPTWDLIAGKSKSISSNEMWLAFVVITFWISGFILGGIGLFMFLKGRKMPPDKWD